MDPREKIKEIMAWANQLPEGATDVLNELRNQEQDLRVQQAKLNAEMTELLRKIAMIEDAVELQRWVEPEPAAAVQPTNGRRPARGREAVLWLLNQHQPEREWTVGEVVLELAERGLAKPDDHHAVNVSLSRLYRSGHIGRPSKGVYSLAGPKVESASTDEAKATDRNRLFTGSAVGEAASNGP